MNHQSKEAQTNFDDWDQGLKARLQELERKVEERNTYIEVSQLTTQYVSEFKEMEKHYKGILANQESQIRKMQNNELGMLSEEVIIDTSFPK